MVFAGFYLEAPEADVRGEPVSGPWTAAFAAADDPGGALPPLRHMLRHVSPITRRSVMTEAFIPKLVTPGQGKTVMLFGVRFSYKVVSADTGGSLAVLEVTIPPGTLVKPHNHSREDEFSLVLSGTVGIRLGDQVTEAGPGAYLVKPRGTPHAMWNTADVPATVAEILSPAGLEGYFEELAPILSQHGTPPEYYQLAEDYGITIQDDWIEDLERTYKVKL